MHRTVTLLGALLLAFTALAKTPTLAVMDLKANGASPELAQAASGLAANELQRLGLFRVVTGALIRDLLAVERQRQLIGCSDDSCMAEIGAALGMDLLVSGRVSRVKGSGKHVISLELTLTDATQARQLSSEIEAAETEAALLGRVGPAVLRLVAPVLARESGRLMLASSEAGALVKVDGRAVGTTPLAGPVTVPGGPHLLSVEKNGFVTLEKEIRVSPGGLVQESVSLFPSPDFVAAYEAGHGRLRIAAWATTGVSVLAAGAGGYLVYQAGQLYGDEQAEGTFLYHRSRLLAGMAVEGTVDHRAEALQLKGSIDLMQSAGVTSLAVAGASAVGAAVFWLLGEDPDRYRQFRPQQAVISLTPAGAHGVLSFSF